MLEDGIQSPDGEALIDLRAQRARHGVERDQDEHEVECPHEAVAREDAAQPRVLRLEGGRLIVRHASPQLGSGPVPLRGSGRLDGCSW